MFKGMLVDSMVDPDHSWNADIVDRLFSTAYLPLHLNAWDLRCLGVLCIFSD